MTALSKRPSRWPFGLAACVIAASVALAIFLLGRAFPPRRVVMATGPEGGAYHELGKRYQAELARQGIRLILESTPGDLTNLSLLKDPKGRVDVTFAAGGMTTEEDSPHVESLGTIGYQPLWIFCRGAETTRLDDLKGKRVSIGKEGGGTRFLMQTLLSANRLTDDVRTVALTPADAKDALLKGEIDCACMLTTADAPAVKALFADERYNVTNFERADAYVTLYPFLRKVILPMGVADLAANRPPHDVQLLASPASLLVRDSLHPGIQYLLLEAAEEIHSRAGALRRPGEFPAEEVVDVPLSDEARSYYKSGGNFLQRHLPFWMWVLAARILLVLIPLAGIVYPLARVVPQVITVWVNQRLNSLYKELRAIEALGDSGSPEAAQELASLEERVRATRVPAAHARALYTLEHHVGLVRDRLMRPNPRSQ
jgi:TRAP-type uncharacterized transport system substrate-binding protein